ncbi:MAG TPA: nuclear transport factor 2 family protein [Acidimicrobiia bacterium]
MTTEPGEALDDTRDYVAITRLQAAYADVVNRRAWAELVDLFEATAMIRVDTVTAEAREFSGPLPLGEFIGGAIERFDFFEFVILNTVVAVGDGVDATVATGRVFMCEIRRDHASEEFSIAFGVYHDRYRRGADGWRFARRDYQSLARTDPPGAFSFPSQFASFVSQETQS